MVQASSNRIEDPSYENNVFVQLGDCEARKACFEEVAYDVKLNLARGDWYTGRVQITFKVQKAPASNLFLEFRAVEIGDYSINGEMVAKDPSIFNNQHVLLPSQMLKTGEQNTVVLCFLNKYRKDGVGLHSFVDKVDNQQYLYTQFEPDYCRYVFPCFDQPDLKATWRFSCVTEQDWTVIANEAVLEDTNSEEKAALEEQCAHAAALFADKAQTTPTEKKLVITSESFRISTYLYAIVAGPFGYHERQKEGFPLMRIYARQSLVGDVNHQEMFNVTEAGMTFYKDFFGKPYPFRKYDQVFVPEHNFGAMENVGCVTYNEVYLYRGQTPTLAKMLRFSITNLHELAHMWFGNLVTMKWWNDLWLNESFATFMSFLAMSKSPTLTHYHDTCWVTFLRYKFWGLAKDCASSTHAICCEITATDQAESLFDGISYGKGSAFLKQFYNILGYDTMSKGLHKYFDRHQWGNTTLPDFVQCLAEAYQESGDTSLGADFDLTVWCDQWLKSSGPNIIEPVVELEDGKLRSLSIKQSLHARGKNRLRLQKLSVGIYPADGGEGEPFAIRDVVISATDETTQVDISGLPAGFHFGAVNVNLDEHAYACVRFDPKSIDWYTENLSKVRDPVSRASIWRYFWRLVMDQKASSIKFFSFVEKQLPLESEDQIISNALLFLSSLIKEYMPWQVKAEKMDILFNVLEGMLQKEGVSKDPVVDQLFAFLSSDQNLAKALTWLEQGKITIEGKPIYDLQAAHKKAIVRNLFKSTAYEASFKQALLDSTLGDDKSDLAERCRATCAALLPDAAEKARVWKEITDPNNTDSLYLQNSKMAGFYVDSQFDLVEPYFEKFFDVLMEQHKTSTKKKFESFFHSMIPTMVIKDSYIVKLVSILQDVPDTEQALQEMLRDGVDLLIRRQKCRQIAERDL